MRCFAKWQEGAAHVQAKGYALLAWRRFLWRTRRARGVIITAHSPGRLPALRRCETSPALLDALLKQLLPQDSSFRGPLDVRRLLSQHHGDIRAVLFSLYDEYAMR